MIAETPNEPLHITLLTWRFEKSVAFSVTKSPILPPENRAANAASGAEVTPKAAPETYGYPKNFGRPELGAASRVTLPIESATLMSDLTRHGLPPLPHSLGPSEEAGPENLPKLPDGTLPLATTLPAASPASRPALSGTAQGALYAKWLIMRALRHYQAEDLMRLMAQANDPYVKQILVRCIQDLAVVRTTHGHR